MVLHPDEKAGEYACTRSSSIAVKLSANAIHTLASLSVYVCMFPLSSFMPGKKKTKKQNHIPGHECTHKSHETRVSYRDVTGPCPLTPRPSSTLRGLEALVSNIQKSPAMATWNCSSPGTVPLETWGSSDPHSVFNPAVQGGTGQAGVGGAAAVQAHMPSGKPLSES